MAFKERQISVPRFPDFRLWGSSEHMFCEKHQELGMLGFKAKSVIIVNSAFRIYHVKILFQCVKHAFTQKLFWNKSTSIQVEQQ